MKNFTLFLALLLSVVSAAAYAEDWAILVDGQVSKLHAPAYGHIYFDSQAECLKWVQATQKGTCVKVPPEPDVGKPERAAWQKKWCVAAVATGYKCSS